MVSSRRWGRGAGARDISQILLGAGVATTARTDNSVDSWAREDIDVLLVVLSKGENVSQRREGTSLHVTFYRGILCTAERYLIGRIVPAVFRVFYACPYGPSVQISIQVPKSSPNIDVNLPEHWKALCIVIYNSVFSCDIASCFLLYSIFTEIFYTFIEGTSTEVKSNTLHPCFLPGEGRGTIFFTGQIVRKLTRDCLSFLSVWFCKSNVIDI